MKNQFELNANDLARLVSERRTVHEYKTKSVDEKTLNEAVGMALWAPNHKMTRPWGFVNITAPARKALIDLAIELKMKKSLTKSLERGAESVPEKGGDGDTEKDRLISRYTQVSHLLAVLQNRTDRPEQSREDYASIAAGLQNMSLYLWNLGIGTKWSTGALIREPRLYDVLRVNSAKEEIVGIFWVGYPSRVPEPQTRPDLKTCLRDS